MYLFIYFDAYIYIYIQIYLCILFYYIYIHIYIYKKRIPIRRMLHDAMVSPPANTNNNYRRKYQ